MTIRNLEHLLMPSSLVWIGAETPDSPAAHIGRIVLRNLMRAPFRGQRLLIDPMQAERAGQPTLASIEALPAPVDLAVITSEPARVPAIVHALGSRGSKAAVIITEPLPPPLLTAALEAARPHTMRLLGPNTLGLMVPPLGLDASYGHVLPSTGDIALVSQSGAVLSAIADWAIGRGVGFSHAISVGDMADVDFGDLLDYLAGDPKCRAILLYVEKINNARKFMSAARRAARAKPVVAVKTGRTTAGRRAAISHSGALIGADAAYSAAFQRAGILRVDDLHDLFDTAEMLARNPTPAGDRLAILTNSGGAGVMAADAVEQAGGRLAQLSTHGRLVLDAALPPGWSKDNPVDVHSDASPERYRSALDVLFAEAEVDAILVLNCPNALASSAAIGEGVIATVKERRTKGAPRKPIIASWLGHDTAREARKAFAANGIASFETPRDAALGYMRMVGFARAQDQLMRMPPALAGDTSPDLEAARRIIDAARVSRRPVLTEVEAKALLAAHGIPVVETAVAANPADVATLAAHVLARHALCVVKVLSDDITHKSEVGGVRLGLASAAEAHAAAVDIAAVVSRRMPQARIAGFSVQPMVRPREGRELLLGMSVDPLFGPVMIFGAGGTEVELVRDTALGLPPLDMNLAHDMIRQTRIAHLLAGRNGRAAVDTTPIARALVQLSGLVATHEEIVEIDINPLVADAEGAVALDARVRLTLPGDAARTPFCIRPYPAIWERTVALPDAGSVLLRPIRPEDEALYEDFFKNVSQTDLRLRFFTPHPQLSHKFLARLTQIDYAREMAFAAVNAEGQLLGVSRFISDPDCVHGEYAILIRSNLKGQGLGWALMEQLIAFARAEGLQEIHGLVLSENATMLRMCQSLGFSVEPDPDDYAVRKVRLDLRAAAAS